MAESFLIGELAVRTGRSVHTIRWYEAQGLMMRDGGSWRIYSELHLSWLDLMDRLRRTGMSIAEMREYTALVKQGSATLKQRQALLSSHRAQVRDMIAEWQLALKLLDSKIDFYDEWVTTGSRPRVKVTQRAGAAIQSLPKEKSRWRVKP